MNGVDDDPLNVRCDACGAEVAEECAPDCLGKAAAQDEPNCLAESVYTDDQV